MRRRLYGSGDSPDQRAPVRWFDLRILWRTALEIAFSAFQVRHFDRRDTYPVAIPTGCAPALDFRDRVGEFWFDFIADTGDGGNATYSVFWSAFHAPVMHGDQRLERGELLVLGGDLCYPKATHDDYQYRFIDLFEAAHRGAEGRPSAIASIPQNHDWYDSLATFARYFIDSDQCAGAPKRFAGTPIATTQSTSYVALELPHQWWIIGLDFGLGHDIDRNQFESLALLAASLRAKPHASVILVYPEPFWVYDDDQAENDGLPRRYRRLEALFDVDQIRLRLAGDLHHYSNIASQQGDRLVVCGAGGAYLHPTHPPMMCQPKTARPVSNPFAIRDEMRMFTRVTRDETGARAAAKTKSMWHARRYDGRVHCYPAPDCTRRIARQLPWAFGWRNPHYAALAGALFVLVGTTGHFALNGPASEWSIGAAALAIAFVLGLALKFSDEQPRSFRWTIGVLHGVAHCAAALIVATLMHQFGIMDLAASPRPLVTLVLGLFVSGLMVGSVIYGSFLWIAVSVFGAHWNESFAALRIEDYKGFLRFRIDAQGVLHGYFIAIDRVCRSWQRTSPLGAPPQSNAPRPIWVPDPNAPIVPRVEDSFQIKRSKADL